ncbi:MULTISPECIES: hypothetical protein [unclassified Arthrobacter]|uniref:hypothetical protein n=1 Tax=unclassified Arthrobacter TaxID=235627 RepID=UPI00159DBD79|nr:MULTISPECIES: hypothetical protein [unclassified Arthrobacter]MCQ9163060.1 hypothetical protein [Arthrobacter sp. STN4]NVM97515.1 hypothetical protein [Arthrobacter sp. SDTb3-6]
MPGPWPGTDPVEAAKVSLGLFTPPQLPSLPQLPSRGIGSDAVGRTASLLVELPVDVQPYGWRLVDRPGNDHRRAVSALSTDINVLADVAGASELALPELKVQAVGPLSLAAAVHLHYGERALRDYGARRDIAQSLSAGLAVHAEKVAAAVPGAGLTLQIDEPAVAAALAGTIATASGYRTLRAISASELRQTWTTFVSAARDAGFAQVALNLAPALDEGGPEAAPAWTRRAESDAWRKALELALESGVDAVAVPLDRLDTGHWEQLAGAVESGFGVWAGTVPARPGQVPPSYSVLVERIMRPWRGLGLAESSLGLLRVTPESGLAGVSPAEARAVVDRTLEVARALTELRHA